MNNSGTSTLRIHQPDQRVRVLIGYAHKGREEERRAVDDVVRDLKLHPLVLEDTTPSSPKQELYRAYVEQSHIFIGIFWKSSSSVAYAQIISYLEEAFLRSNGKPLLIYIEESLQGRDPELEPYLERIRREAIYCYRPFSSSAELTEFIQNDILQLLSETFGLAVREKRYRTPPLPDYLQELHSEVEQHGLVKRTSLLREVQEYLASNTILLLVGEPGIGKTYLLETLGTELDAIYISVRNKTTQQVCAYLANHLLQRRNQVPQNLLSEDEARAALQQELADTRTVLLIDDADDNPTVAQALLGLDFFSCKVVFAACAPQATLYQRVKRIQIVPFAHQDMRDFLALHNVSLPPGEFQQLYTASQGNPLYLYYFTQQQISPLPEDLEDYQQVLWEKLSPFQQEVLALLAHSLIPLRVDDLHALLNAQQQVSRTVMETKSLLTSTIPLVHQLNDVHEFFHARFAEYIRTVVACDGLSSHYHLLLGEHAIRKQRVVAAAYHLLHANDSRVEGYLISGSQIALLQGEYQQAERFLLRALQSKQKDVQEKLASHDIYIVYEEGIRRLLSQLNQIQPAYSDVLVYQQRLVENITQTRRYGDTETRRAERAEIIDRLNELTLSVSNCTFVDLCKKQELLQVQTTKERDDILHREAYIRYLLAQVYLELGHYVNARREVDTSITLFEVTKEEEWKGLVELWSNLLLLEEGQSQQAIEALERALKVNQIQDVFEEAYIQLNLSNAYLHVSQFRKGAEAAKRATDLFKQLKNTRGVYVSLTNLAANIGHLGAYTLQQRYAEQIIQAATEHNLLRLRCAGLNILAVAQRSLGDPLAAQACLEECIRISQKIGSVELEVLNIINLGNALRDQKLEAQANDAYTEALTKAQQNHFTKHEAHALELLARSSFSQECYEESIKLGVKALALQLPLGEHLRIAITQSYLARCYLKLNQQQQAAEYYEESGKHYEVTELWHDAIYQYGQAAGIWDALAESDRALYCIMHGTTCALRVGDVEEAERLIGIVPSTKQSEQIGEFYLHVLRLLLEQRKSIPYTMFMYNFSAYCKRITDPLQKRTFQRGLDMLVAVLAETASDQILNALGVSIEQTNEALLSSSDCDMLAERVSQAVDHLHYRHDTDGLRVWTIGLNWQKPLIIQIRCLSDEPIVQRVAMSLALILLANRQRIEKVIAEYGESRERGLTLDILTQRDLTQILEEDILTSQKNKQLSAMISESSISWGEPQPPTTLILHDDYELMHNWATHPENKAFVWILMLIHSAIVAHCIHQSRESVPDLAKKNSKFCHEVLDFVEHSDEMQSFTIKIEDL